MCRIARRKKHFFNKRKFYLFIFWQGNKKTFFLSFLQKFLRAINRPIVGRLLGTSDIEEHESRRTHLGCGRTGDSKHEGAADKPVEIV